MSLSPARALLAAALLAAAVPTHAGAAPTGACPDRVTSTADGWTRVEGPRFAVGLTRITAYAVASDAKKTTIVTNGSTVMRTTDGGCSWGSVFTVPETPSAEYPFDRDSATILDVVAARKRVYALVRTAAGPRVLVSSDNGRTWASSPMPSAESALDLGAIATRTPSKLVADVDGLSAYILVKTAGGGLTFGGDLVYATSDGGATWTPRPIDPTGGPVSEAVDIAVDPLVGDDLFVALEYGLLQSPDSGDTWTYDQPPGTTNIGRLAVTHRPGRSRQVAVTNANEPVVNIRISTGTWTTVNTPGMVTSIVGGRTTRQAAITTPSGVYELDYGSLEWLPIHTGFPGLTQLETDFTTSPNIYACECTNPETAIWHRTPRRADDAPEPDDRGNQPVGYPGYDGCAPAGKQRPPAAKFAPSQVTQPAEVAVAPGRSVTLPVRFRVQPRELDLYFLLDSGPRSYYFTCQAKQGALWAADQLAHGRNVRAGAGEYRDFFNPGRVGIGLDFSCISSAHTKDFVYRRDVRIGEVDDVFREAVSNVTVGGCTADHAGLTALYQSVTGAGQDVAPKGSTPYDIRPRQDAGFADDAYKVIVHVAGGYFAQPGTGYPGNSWDETIRALVQNDVKQVGIHVPYAQKKHHPDDEPVPDETGASDLRQIARATGTLSSRDIDCGKEVLARVKKGGPLVCSFVDDSPKPTVPPMGRQIVDLVTALRDPQPMRMALVSGDAVLTPRSASAGRTLDHLLPQTLDYAVTITCKDRDYGTVKRVELAGVVGADYVATSTASVRCGAPPVPRKPLTHYDAAPPLPLAGAAAIGNTIPNVQPQVQTASQTQANPQQLAQLAGAANPQEQGEPRLAYVETNPRSADEEELAMSALPPAREADVPIWAFVNAVALTSAAAAFALRRRTRTAVAKVRR